MSASNKILVKSFQLISGSLTLVLKYSNGSCILGLICILTDLRFTQIMPFSLSDSYNPFWFVVPPSLSHVANLIFRSCQTVRNHKFYGNDLFPSLKRDACFGMKGSNSDFRQ